MQDSSAGFRATALSTQAKDSREALGPSHPAAQDESMRPVQDGAFGGSQGATPLFPAPASLLWGHLLFLPTTVGSLSTRRGSCGCTHFPPCPGPVHCLAWEGPSCSWRLLFAMATQLSLPGCRLPLALTMRESRPDSRWEAGFDRNLLHG